MNHYGIQNVAKPSFECGFRKPQNRILKLSEVVTVVYSGSQKPTKKSRKKLPSIKKFTFKFYKTQLQNKGKEKKNVV
jgi:hypothetical protein